MIKRKSANMQITRECNNECIFCSNPQFEKEYSFKDSKQTVLKLKEEGVNEIFLTGGEPTTVNYLPEIIRFIKKQGIEPRMITNGVKLSDKKLVKKIYNAGLRSVNVSVHSSNQELADKLSQKNGHFKKTLQGIKNLLRYRFDVQINSTINSLNGNLLLEYSKFFTKNFPEIKHFVFNGLDPGCSDGNLKSRAGKNPWIIARFVDFELELNRMTNFLTNEGKTFRIERVPLCYMQGFEEFSTETRKIVKNEQYICSFIEKGLKNEIKIHKPLQLRTKVDCCAFCKLNKICSGMQKEYLMIHGDKEFYPIFSDPQKIIDKIKNER